MFDYLIWVRWALFCVGITYVFVSSALFTAVRIVISRYVPLVKYLIYCPYCMAFWIGLLTYSFGLCPEFTSVITPQIELGIISIAIVGIVARTTGLFDVSQVELEAAGLIPTEGVSLDQVGTKEDD